MASILVTGINGFVGRHLAQALHDNGDKVIGIERQASVDPKIAHLVSNYYACDLTHADEIAKLPLEDVNAVINLAGLAAVGKSFEQPDLYMEVNVKVLSVLCERVKQLGRKDLRIVAVSTGAVYASNQPMPLTELSKVSSASSPYAASKLAMENAAKEFRSNGFDCVIARPFNHLGPGQAEGFLLPDLFQKIQLATNNNITVGNLQSQRDYTDVRDVAKAYIALAAADRLQYDTYNVCSGKAVAGTEILDSLKRACGVENLRTIVDRALFRPSDQPILFGDNSRMEETGWEPTIALDQTIKDFIEASS
jgi:GDP-4-dehydro-6-deoxy-D-mannose reductase